MHPGAPAPSVLCLGAIVQDTLAISHSPLQLGDDVPGTALVRPGGVATNIALALAHAGVRTGLAGAVGQDAIGRHLITTLQAARVDCTCLLQRPGTSDQVVTLENPDGERFAAVADCRQLDAAATEQPEAFETAVRAWDGEIVLDGNLPADLIARLLDAAPHTAYLVPASRAKAAHLGAVIRDHRPALIVNLGEAAEILGGAPATSRDAAEALRRHGALEAAVTDGSAAAALATESDTVTATPEQITRASTTGAGDAFVAGIVAAGRQPARDRLAAAMAAAAAHLRRDR